MKFAIPPPDAGSHHDPSPPQPLLNEVEAAAKLTIKPATLAYWRATKRVPQPAYLKIGKALRYRHEDLDAFIEASRR
jgi:hypothetical protein